MSAVDQQHPVPELLGAGYAAIGQGNWAESRRCFEAALEQGELPEALEGLGLAAYFVDDAPLIFASRERAYLLYRERGDRLAAARLACLLGDDYAMFRGEMAISSGWLQRARRLLDGLPPSLEHGMLAGFEGFVALLGRHDVVAARQAADTALEMARTLGSVDLEVGAISIQGLALVYEGRVSEGLRLLDEATTAALSGEVHSLDMVIAAFCQMIYACERVRDFERAAQWCEKVRESALRYDYRALLSYCRMHYAAVLIWRGDWAEAAEELEASTGYLSTTRVGMAVEGVLRLAELRRRQGRREEADDLFRRVGGHPFASLGRAALAYDVGDDLAASDLVDRHLRQLSAENLLERVDGLELALRVRCRLGRIDAARAALAELELAAEAVGTPPFQGLLAAARGWIADATGDADAARRSFEDAVDCFMRCGAPWETARARLDLARALVALGRVEAAAPEARVALETLRTIGAEPDAARAAALLARLAVEPRANGAAPPLPAGLTRREAEVLGLLARGMSNQEIAGSLFLSVRTVERHISTMYGKIGVVGPAARAAASAFAFRHGLMPGQDAPSVHLPPMYEGE